MCLFYDCSYTIFINLFVFIRDYEIMFKDVL